MDEFERVREGKVQERGAELQGDLILAEGGFGWTGTAPGGGGATAQSLQRGGRRPREDFANRPLALCFSFRSGPFPFLFLFFFLNQAVFQLFGAPNIFQNL